MKVSTVLRSMMAVMLLTGCASRPLSIPVIAGPQADLSALVGEWDGEYNSPETGRSGTITFTLQSGKDTAFGNVVMVPRRKNEPVTSGAVVDGPLVRTAAVTAPTEILTIRFVRLENERVIGTLDPYHDPDCGCQLTTTFRGVFVDASTISGTFNSVGSSIGHFPSSGAWKVTRAAP
jgi:hypothetical protein